MQDKPNIWQIADSLFGTRPSPTAALWLSVERAECLKLTEKRNFRLKFSKTFLPKHSIFCHLCSRHFRMVFEEAAWVLSQKSYRRWEVILYKDILDRRAAEILSHQAPKLAKATCGEAFSLRGNFRNHMRSKLCLTNISCPVCHRAQAGAVVCPWGALILKQDPSPPADTRREGDFCPI